MFERVEVAGRLGDRSGFTLHLCERARDRQHLKDSGHRRHETGRRLEARALHKLPAGLETLLANAPRDMMNGVNSRPPPIDGPQCALGCTSGTVPQNEIGALLFGQLSNYVRVEIESDDTCQTQCLVIGELRGTEGIPREDEPLGEWIEIVLALRAK